MKGVNNILKTAEFKSTIAEIQEVESEDFQHPLLTLAKFVFLDDRPNDNNQGVREEDFADIIASAIDTPVKMLFTGSDVRGHFGSIPVGHIKNIEAEKLDDGTNRLIGTAMLYREEYPEEILYLKESYVNGEAPGISYELQYKDSIVENGIEWLKKITTKAATFVKTPAYGSRTALLALASNTSLSQEEVVDSVISLAHEWEPKEPVNDSKDEGGNQSMELEQRVQELEADAATKQGEIERLTGELVSKDATIEELKTKIADFERVTLISERERKYVEAGFSLESDAEKLAKKREFWASLSDEAFNEYIADLVSVKATAPSTASASTNDDVPKFAVAGVVDRLTIDELKQSVRNRDNF